MRLTVSADALRAALARVGKVIAAKQVIPILGTVRFEAFKNAVFVTASSYEMTITARVPGAEVEEPGVACIPAAELTKLVTLAKKAPVAIDAGELSATLTWGRTSAELLTLPAAEFPKLPDYAGLDMQDVGGQLLARAMKFAAVAMGDEETRHYLRGVYLAGEDDGGAVAVATDGHRLHRAILPACRIEGAGILPADMVPAIAEILDCDGRVQMHLGATAWAVVTEDVQARGSVIDATFPDYKRVIPPNAELAAVADREALREAIEIAATGAEKTGRTVHVVLDVAGDEIAVRGFKPGSALAKGVTTSTEAQTRAPVRISLNSTYLADSLRALDCDRVAILSPGPMVVHVEPAEQAADLRLLALTMGIRADERELAA